MADTAVSADFDHPAETVWAVVRDFGGIGQWMPGIDSCTVSGDERTLHMLGIDIVERNLGIDDDTRRAGYGIVGGGLQIAHHQASIAVEDLPGGRSRVVWAFSVEPESLVSVMSQSYSSALKALATHLARDA